MTSRFESALRLHRSGLLDDVLFRGHRAWILSWITTPGGMRWWSFQRQAYSDDVREYLDAAIEDRIDLPEPITDFLPYYGITDDE